MQEIYVRLLGEGTTVYRPVKAIENVDSTFTIVGEDDINCDDEEWEFRPGSRVIVKSVEIGGNMRLLASRLATKAP